MPEIIEETVQVESEFYNVKETYPLYDTVCITGDLSSLSRVPPGWFTSFATLGSANEIHFFDTRNKASAGIAYCNLDSIDTMSFGYLLRGISCKFFAPTVATLIDDRTNWVVDAHQGAFFTAEMARHCGFKLRVNQDYLLKCNAFMPGGGDGPTFGGFGQLFNNLGGENYDDSPGMFASNFSTPEDKGYWIFPKPIGIPRRASVSVIVEPNQFCKEILADFLGPYHYDFLNTTLDGRYLPSGIYGIRVGFYGNRLVQQRGQLHA